MNPDASASSSNHASLDIALEHLALAVRDTGYRFTTVTPASIERVNGRPGNEWAVDIRGVFGWNRRFRPDVLPAALFEQMHAAGVLARDGEGWRSTIRLSTLDDQLFIHSAYPTNDRHSVFFGPDTYRYASAIRRQLAAQAGPIRRAVDIGSGAGPGAILIASARPDAEVFAADINPEALRLTGINARLARAANVISRHSDILAGVDGEFDLIVANPPYLLDPEERVYRHGGGSLGAGLSISIVEATARLAPGGTLLLYTGVAIVDGHDPFLETIAGKLDRPGLRWDYREIDPDVFGEELSSAPYAQADRIAAVVLAASRA